MKSFDEFWPFYLGEHANRYNRSLHFFGTLGAVTLIVTAFITGRWLLVLSAPVWGYGCAWIGHFFIEKNTPATFTYPLWSLRGDIRMFGLMFTGRMTAELQRRGLAVIALLMTLAHSPGPAAAQGLQQARPWMGIVIENKPGDGVEIKNTVEGTPARNAGLLSGDVIKKVDGKPMTDVRELISYIQSRGVGNEVKVEYVRAGKAMTLTLKLEAKPDELELLRKTLHGRKVPDFSLADIVGGKPFTSKDIAGKVAVIEFWATWCPACRDSHPRLSAFAAEQKDISVLTVSDEETVLLKAYADKIKPQFRVLQDTSKEFSQQFSVSAIPMTVVVDKSGKIIFATLGAGGYLEEALSIAVEESKKK
jgi:thiol-disulfide isomerase/thioredoxin